MHNIPSSSLQRGAIQANMESVNTKSELRNLF